MKVLVIGNGGREHALAWKIAQSPRVNEVIIAPGNAGTAAEAKCTNADVSAEDIDGLLALAQECGVDLTVVGPEAPLAAGLVDRFQANGLRCFGPSQQAAQLEASKAFSKRFMHRHNIPTAQYRTITTVDDGMAFLATTGLPAVIKADGLAAGKGVVIAETEDQVRATLEDMLTGQAFGEAGRQVVMEECLAGEEASFIVMAAGRDVVPMATSQDHKRRDNQDAGPNTGGMGAYSPAPVLTEALQAQIMDTVIRPTVAGLEAEGMAFTGFLYAGIMLTADGPKVLEFNVRFGDPETQPIMMRLQSDLVDLIEAALDGELTGQHPQWDQRTALGVVMASKGYPGSYDKGCPITGLERIAGDDVKAFHAGTGVDGNGQIITQGGRVLSVVALGEDVKQAQALAHEQLKHIAFDGALYRTDIGQRAIDATDALRRDQ